MLPYIGGKSTLASWIISQFPKDYETKTYCEVFGGGGWVLFKKERSYLEVYNDLNHHLVNLFKVIRDRCPEFQNKANWSLHSREMFIEARERLKDDQYLDEIEKALHYAISKTQAFAGKGGWAYQVSAKSITNGKWLPFVRRIEHINARLQGVQIECLDFEKVIGKYDSKNTVFYLDPPYVSTEFFYKTAGVDFKREDHKRLAGILKHIKGKFVLSYYDHPLIRELYPNFEYISKEHTQSCSGLTRGTKSRVRPKETSLLIRNF